MTQVNKKRQPKKDSPEQALAEEALKRMKSFGKRKEKFVAAIKTSKDRDISS